MHWLAAIALDLVLAVALLGSIGSAAAWGELSGIPPGRDKSGLGGFAAVLIFLLLRGAAVALALVDTSPATEGPWLLGGHVALGWIGWRAFSAGVDRVQRDRVVPLWLCIAFATLLPLPALTLTLVRTNANWLGTAPAMPALVGATLFALHAACFRRGRRGGRR